MATVIDALIVTLGLDATKFTAGQKQSNEALGKTRRSALDMAKEWDHNSRRMAAGVVRIRNELLTMLAVFTAGVGIKNFTADTYKQGAALGQVATNLGMGTRELTAWQRANENALGTSEAMTAQLQSSANTIAKFKLHLGVDETITKTGYFGQLTEAQFKKALSSGTEFLLARADIIAKLDKQDHTLAKRAAAEMGIDEGTYNLLKQGRAEVEKLLARKSQISSLSEEQTRTLLQVEQHFIEFRQKLIANGEQLEVRFAPLFDKILTKLDEFVDWFQKHPDDIEKWVQNIIATIVDFAKQADGFAQSVGGWKVVFEALLAMKIGSWALQLLVLAANLGTVATSLAGLAVAGAPALPILLALGAIGYTGYKVAEYVDYKLHPEKFTSVPGAPVSDTGTPPVRVKQGAYSGIPYDAKILDSIAAKAEEKYGLPKGQLVRLKNYGERTPIDPRTGTYATSPKGAAGLMQFMPGTWEQYGQGKDVNDPAAALDAAGRYFRDLLTHYKGDADKATAAYNYGQGNVDKHGLDHLPAETASYLRRVQGSPFLNGSAQVALNTPRPEQGRAPVTVNNNTSTTTSETTVQQVTIYSAATDAEGIAKSIKPALERVMYAAQANDGMRQ